MPRINAGQFTRQGKQSETNGDAVVVLNRAPKGNDKGASLAAVMDGMGGDSVSEMACSTISELLSDFFRTRNLAEPGAILVEAIKAANHRIFSERNSQRSLKGMGASVAAAIITGNDLHVAHVGDCRIYIQRGSSLYRVTKDHSWREDGGTGGGADGVAGHLMDKAVTRSIGYRKEVEVDLAVHRIRKGDQVLLCTDGVSDSVTEREIMGCLGESSPIKACRTLVETSASRGDDDCSAVVLQIGMPAWRMKRLTIAALLFVLSISMISLAVKKILVKKSSAAASVSPGKGSQPVKQGAQAQENRSLTDAGRSGGGKSAGMSDEASRGAVPTTRAAADGKPGNGLTGAASGIPAASVSKEKTFEIGDFLKALGAVATDQKGNLLVRGSEASESADGEAEKLISSALADLLGSPGNDLMDACAAVRSIQDPRTAGLAFKVLSKIASELLSDSIDSTTLPATGGEVVRNWTTDPENPSRFVTLCASRKVTQILDVKSESGVGITVEAEALPAMARNPFMELKPVRLSPSRDASGDTLFKFDACPGDRLLFKISSSGSDPRSGFRMTISSAPMAAE